jgi:hypothetical protein
MAIIGHWVILPYCVSPISPEKNRSLLCTEEPIFGLFIEVIVAITKIH